MTPFHFHTRITPETERGSVVVPAGIETKKDLLGFLGDALPLPGYFGNNWDALEECLNDLQGQTGGKIVLIHQDLPISGSSSDQKMYLEILAEIARTSSRLQIVFPEWERKRIEHLLSDDAKPL